MIQSEEAAKDLLAGGGADGVPDAVVFGEGYLCHACQRTVSLLPEFALPYPGGGGYAGEVFNVAYTRAVLQAALAS